MKVLVCTALLGGLVVGTSDAQAQESGEFQKHIAPFFKQHCIKCHGPDKQSARLALHKIDANLKAGKDATLWRKIRDRLKKGEMPPKKEPRPNADAVQRVIEWIDAELPKNAGQSALHHGNEVDHHLLFHAEPPPPLDAPPRLWRISPYVYDALVRDLTRGRIKYAQPLTYNSKHGFKDYAAGATIDESTAVQLIRNARAIVQYQTQYEIKDGKIRGRFGAAREFIPLFDPKNEPKEEDVVRAIKRQFENVVRREPTAKELDQFNALLEKNIKAAGRETGVRTTLAAILLLPEVLYRSEMGQGERDEHGRVRLTPREIAFAISYTLTDRRPDGTMLKAAKEGKLDTQEGVAKFVEGMLKNERVNKPRIMRLFQEYFGYEEALHVFKEKKKYKEHEPRVLVSDTNLLIEHILEKDRNVLYELLTTNKSFVNYRKDRRKGVIPATKRKVRESYSLSNWSKNQPMTLPSDQRAGILTQPSWLVANSANSENHAIHRGKWVRERLLGGVLPDLPITVDAQLSDDPKLTLREKMNKTKATYCWQCHRKMNPLGLTFEIFDHYGRYRTEELGEPVDAHGSVDNSGEPGLDGEVKNAIQMLHKLAKSPKVEQVFVRHAFRYFMGRDETPGDAKSLRETYRAYKENGGSMNALISALLSSESFLYRVSREEKK